MFRRETFLLFSQWPESPRWELISAIQTALAPLVGMRLWDAGRAASMLWLQLGERVHAPTARDPDRVTGEYALHVQCPWRISSVVEIVTGSSDMFIPADPTADRETFEWDRPGTAILDVQLIRWIAAHAQAPLVIASIEVDRCGGFILRLSEGFAVEVFPDSSAISHSVSEEWRLLQPASNAEHFVLTNGGIE